ncbi:predicted protein [Pyrenophora tritici-repentis Pt-1C-BFP]|uniref:Uncharacterized protein n=1 Tax=Pyrenophora tritici-repentis (strain Pt-1C-BFP) TaxID=426418 RepID=B2WM80_PYRTR|nr:uncharacterized protein PTRG_11090 [Pyrenophora tritici-repentis Pt-1C-BFP]EDU44140.1 predicted protein [Pyrenophora tritici-repentis Pt-1C-BFP]
MSILVNERAGSLSSLGLDVLTKPNELSAQCALASRASLGIGARSPFSLSPPPPPLSPRQALVAAPQAPNFEATLRESRAEETIIPPPKGSEHATVAALGAASEAVDEGFV